MINHCGSCRACCKAFDVPLIDKPAGKWCPHVGPTGCGIQAAKPITCVAYECLWLQTQQYHWNGPSMRPEFRPDQSGVILDSSKDGQSIVARAEPFKRHVLESGPMFEGLKRMAARGITIILVSGTWRRIIPGAGAPPSHFSAAMKIELGQN